MGLVNCTACQHPMSAAAKVCPNCNNPRQIENTKECQHCGTQMSTRKQKCPECGQTTQNMAKTNYTRQSSSSNNNRYIIALLAILLGGLIMYASLPAINDEKPVSTSGTAVIAPTRVDTVFIIDSIPPTYKPEEAQVKKINGLYIFVESEPLNSKGYTVLGTIEGENPADMINSLGIGKEKFGKVLENIFLKTQENANFRSQLEKMTELVITQYPQAQGLIFTNRIRKCEVIVFK